MSGQRVHSVFIDLEGDELAYQYMCREGDTVPPLATFRKSAHVPELHALSDGLGSALFARGDRSDARLKDWGGKLYDKLIPIDLADKLQADRRSPSYLVLYIHPSLVWIPWELLWDGEDFLCIRFRVARQLQKNAGEHRAAEQRLHHDRSGRGALVIFGDVTGLEASAEKSEIEQALATLYGSKIWFRKAQSATDLLELLKQDYDICHFIGHGRYVADAPAETGWMLADGAALTCRDIESVSSHATFPLLFNALYLSTTERQKS